MCRTNVCLHLTFFKGYSKIVLVVQCKNTLNVNILILSVIKHFFHIFIYFIQLFFEHNETWHQLQVIHKMKHKSPKIENLYQAWQSWHTQGLIMFRFITTGTQSPVHYINFHRFSAPLHRGHAVSLCIEDMLLLTAEWILHIVHRHCRFLIPKVHLNPKVYSRGLWIISCERAAQPDN